MVLNIGTGIEVHIADIYDTIQSITCTNYPLIKKGPRIGDVRRSAIDFYVGKKRIGLGAKSHLGAGIRLTYEWAIDKSNSLSQ